MKDLVFYACVLTLFFSVSSELKQQRNDENDYKVCMNATGITPDNIHSVWLTSEDIIANVHIKPENEERMKKTGCLLACILKRQNLMEGSNIKEAQVVARLPEFFEVVDDSQKKTVRKCMEEGRSITQECEKCFSIYVCLVKATYNIESQKHGKHEKKTERVKTKAE
ncbi:uncharacterized protein LOC105835453 isoform X2 [Monomorium pharaonis]|uniref:uncharacterized protein LOC105835453 isoform X2 n=1 Tax=Monomorium pharaonis TaxID=307658 RepID=UPI00102E188D|nr:uncharacterized protein LOC105835453 isoform X2 [Monomorium pharaonis]